MLQFRSLAAAALAALLLVPAAGSAQVATVSPAPCPAGPCTPPISSSQLLNLGQLQTEISAYYKNGSYAAEVDKIEADATSYIDKRVAAGAKKPALVLDIDDTALLTLPFEEKYGFGYTPDLWNAYAADPGFPAIPQTLALAKHAQAKGVGRLLHHRPAQRGSRPHPADGEKSYRRGLHLRAPLPAPKPGDRSRVLSRAV